MKSGVIIDHGVLKLDGQPKFVWSADYPYYRDQRADWSGQLDNLKRMNVHVVTFYIPWRHHAPADPLRAGGRHDFRGALNDRTDVLEFIRLIRSKGMLCIAKPGPYIHAETRFGSLPDYVLPQNNPAISDRVDMEGRPSPGCWGFERPPAPMDPEYLRYVKDWFRAVGREVIEPNQYPHGPIVAVQVLNEGLYSDGGYGVDKINFDAAAVSHYRKFLKIKYGSIEKYNTACGTRFADFAEVPAAAAWTPQSSPAAVRPWIDWAEFGQYFYRLIAGTYIGYLRECGVTLPMLLNINPPAVTTGPGLETVMGRYTVPYLSSVVQYGYTNWCGVVPHDETAYLKYKIVGKSARGINMEENWGFDSYDPPNYWCVQPSLFQSLAYMLWGATGLNIYLGVSCDCWTDYLAVDAGGVYMHNHPIAEDGTYRDSFWTCHQLGALMKNIGDDLVAQDAAEPVAWAFYSPYAHAGSWGIPAEDWARAGFRGKPGTASAWVAFMALCDKQKTRNGICYPREEPVHRLLRHAILFLEGGDWMDAATQHKLVEYVEKGGVLVLVGRAPELGEFFEPCAVLKDALFGGPAGAVEYEGNRITCGIQAGRGKGKALLLEFSPWQPESWPDGLIEHLAREYAGVKTAAPVRPEPNDPLVETAEYRCDAKGRRHVYVLTRREEPSDHEIVLADVDGSDERFALRLPAFSGAIVSFEKGRILSAFIRGTNDLDKSAAAPALQYGGAALSAEDPCDLYFCRNDQGAWELSVVNVQHASDSTTVTLPLKAAETAGVFRLTSTGRKIPVEFREADGWVQFTAMDMRCVEDEGSEEGEWSPGYIVTVRG